MPDPYAISIRTAAELDIKEAVEWYREKAPLQVAPLIQALSERFDLICRNPFLFQIRYRDIRITFLRQFPYGIQLYY